MGVILVFNGLYFNREYFHDLVVTEIVYLHKKNSKREIQMSLPRELLKWCQLLNLSLPIKKTNRDFANGFLIAEILSNYYPGIINTNSFDNGIGPNARKSNWDHLEKIFTKLNLRINHELVKNVANKVDLAAAEMLTIIYNHVEKKTISVDKKLCITNSDVKVDFKQDVIEKNIIEKKELVANIVKVESEENIGKLVLAKHYVNTILGCNLAPSCFSKVGFQMREIRDAITNKMYSTTPIEFNEIKQNLIDSFDKSMKIVATTTSLIPIELFLKFVSFSQDVSMVFETSLLILLQIADCLVKTRMDAFQKLISCTEFNPILNVLINDTNNAKIFHISNLILAYCDPESPENSRISKFAVLKNLINELTEHPRYSSAFIALLSSMLHHEPQSIINRPQLIVFYLSESLTIINTHKQSFKSVITSQAIIDVSFSFRIATRLISLESTLPIDFIDQFIDFIDLITDLNKKKGFEVLLNVMYEFFKSILTIMSHLVVMNDSFTTCFGKFILIIDSSFYIDCIVKLTKVLNWLVQYCINSQDYLQTFRN